MAKSFWLLLSNLSSKFSNVNRSSRFSRSSFSVNPSSRFSRSSFSLNPVRFPIFSKATLDENRDDLLRPTLSAFKPAMSFPLVAASPAVKSAAFVVPTPRKLESDELATIRLFQENAPSVVSVTNIVLEQDTKDMVGSFGSGFLWDQHGHIVTNFNVIADASIIRVTLFNHTTVEAKVIGFEREYDIAVLLIDAQNQELRPITLGLSNDLLVGQKVFAIGNPFGLHQSLSTGVISGLERELCSMVNLIQIDAAINFGNYGGPLFDSSGRLIGMNTWNLSHSEFGESCGVALSIPVSTVVSIVDQLITPS